MHRNKIRLSIALLAVMLAVTVFLFGSIYVMAIGEDTPTPQPPPVGTPIPPATATQIPQPAVVPAQVINEEGGPAVITGSVSYSDPRFASRVSQPVIILEDQAGFVDRNEFFLMPVESQTLAQITSDIFVSPFTYSLTLPITPKGTLRDVDNDGQTDTGVMVFAPAYWNNVFGDPYLEERDLFGGGWSSAYVSTRISESFETQGEVIGGKYVIYAPEAGQGFPAGFGPDRLLFTADDPIAIIPQGYSVVEMDSEPFVFNRAREQELELFEPASAAADDFGPLGYAAAFDAMVDKLSKEYAFTELKGLDWNALSVEYRPRFAAAESSLDPVAYALALRDFLWEIPDGHVSMSLDPLIPIFQQETDGGLGMAVRQVDDGRVIVNYLVTGGPAEAAGIRLGAEILEIGGESVESAMQKEFLWGHEAFGTPENIRIQQLRYVTRFQLGIDVDVTYKNPGDALAATVTLPTVEERESFAQSSIRAGRTFVELPVEFDILPSGYGYVNIFSFSDNQTLTAMLWERMIQIMNANQIPGLVIDMRQNNGGSGFMANQLAAYFFDQPHVIGSIGYYDEDLDDFFFDPRGAQRFYLPEPNLRYPGEVAVLVGPACFSACEFFSYNMTIENRAAIVGQYPSGGLGGSVDLFFMPEGIVVGYTIGRAVDANGNIHIEGKGVQPTVKVPITEETLFTDSDVVLDAAVAHLDRILGPRPGQDTGDQ